jgi:mRNA interferase YafQ
MRTIERSSAFKRDYKRAKATPRHSKDVDSLVSTVVALLLSDRVLPENNRDWAGYRECHIKPDMLLIYRKPDAEHGFDHFHRSGSRLRLASQFLIGRAGRDRTGKLSRPATYTSLSY